MGALSGFGRHASIALAAFAVALAGGVAAAQAIRVDSVPSGARLVCDGSPRGVTPLAINPQGLRTCTLFLTGHENLHVTLDEESPPVVRVALTPIAHSPPPTLRGRLPTGVGDPSAPVIPWASNDRGTVDPDRRCRSGVALWFDRSEMLFRPCPGVPTAGSSRRSAVASPARCGTVDRRTGLITPCWDTLRAGALAVRASRHPSRGGASPSASPSCGHVDPTTGLIHPCFGDEPADARSRPEPRNPWASRNESGVRTVVQVGGGRGRACGGRDPYTGLLVPCLD